MWLYIAMRVCNACNKNHVSKHISADNVNKQPTMIDIDWNIILIIYTNVRFIYYFWSQNQRYSMIWYVVKHILRNKIIHYRYKNLREKRIYCYQWLNVYAFLDLCAGTTLYVQSQVKPSEKIILLRERYETEFLWKH